MSDPESIDWIKERIGDKKHFTARLLASLSEASGMEIELLAKIVVGSTFLLLALWDQAHFLANLLLVGVPFLLIFVYPQEKPTDESLLVFFSVFGGVTLLDRNLEKMPCYYVLKLLLFVLLYLPPYRLVDKIEEFIKKQAQQNESKAEEKSRRSDRKTLKSTQPLSSITRTPEVKQQPSVESKSPKEEKAPADPVASPVAEPAEAVTPIPEPSRRLTLSAKSATDLVGGSQRHKRGQNPMQANSFYNLKSEPDGFNSKLIGPAGNLNDLLFFPQNTLIFNAPFDYDNLTYHMKITNNSHHRIAYAVKGNAVPRVMANPPFGILSPKEYRLIAVTVQKFVYNDTDYEKDRIAFDYVILPDQTKDKEFNMRMFQTSDTKRRKNIYIRYNP